VAIATTNPSTGEVIKAFDTMSDAEVDVRLDRAQSGFDRLRQTSFADRAAWMRAAADILDAEAEDIARTMTLEMGKTLASARAEVAKCAKGCRHYAEHAAAYLADEAVEPSAVAASRAFVRYDPIGAVLAIMPWNFPLWQAMRFAAPALMAGNVGLLKHASNVPQSALFMEALFLRAGFPAGSFQTLLIGSADVERVIADRRVRAVTLTGSEAAGRSVAAIAGRELKKTVLELGGSDPFIVLPSADIDRAVPVGVQARMQNTGQSCIAAKRFIVHDEVADAFIDAFVAGVAALSVGDPFDPATEVGPLVTSAARDNIEALVEDARSHGASILCGGERIVGPGGSDKAGYYYLPTVIADITSEMRVATEEVFGPVALLFRVSSADEALSVANGTDFGLGSSVWTGDPDEQQQFVQGLEAGQVFVNGMVASMPELPFGGIKTSGIGRELSVHGIREFCNIKSVWVA
jgi:succinate-semialdehyde dehydrogenase/glutarate-semialdehyde dehydrogenase